MAKAVLTTKVNPTYDDLPEERYHFPRSYLNQVQHAVGDFAVYYEPRRSSGEASSRGGRQAYFAVARVVEIEPDPARADHYYAQISDYLEFDRPGPFREADHYFESGLQREDGATSKGAFGRAVRQLPDREFDSILRAGFAGEEMLLPQPLRQPGMPAGFDEPQADFERPIIESVVIAAVPRSGVHAAGSRRLRQSMCRDRAAAVKRGRTPGSSGRTHSPGRQRRSRLCPQRSGPFRHRALDVRPRPPRH